MGSIILMVIWLLIWTVFAGFFELVIVRHGINHLKKFYITSIYFLSFAIISFFIFKKDILFLVTEVSITAIIWLILYYLVTILIYYLIRKNVKPPKEFIVKNPKLYFAQLDWRHIVSNSFVILCQQIIFLSIFSVLWQNGFSIIAITGLLVALVFLMHIVYIFTIGHLWGWHFTIFSSIYAFIYPLLILSVKDGVVYAFMMHSIFYTINGIGIWFYFKKTK